MNVADLVSKLEALRVQHNYCDDSHYTCPKHPDAWPSVKHRPCDCGADKHNAKVDEIIASIQSARQRLLLQLTGPITFSVDLPTLIAPGNGQLIILGSGEMADLWVYSRTQVAALASPRATHESSGKLCCATVTIQGSPYICNLPLEHGGEHHGEHADPAHDIRWDDRREWPRITAPRATSAREETPKLDWRGTADEKFESLEKWLTWRGLSPVDAKSAVGWVRESVERVAAIEANAAPRARESATEKSLLDAINKACAIIELGDQRLLASDGPAGGQPPDLTLKEWRTLYVTLDNARKGK